MEGNQTGQMLTLQEKLEKVKRDFCFYIDVADRSIAKTLRKRIEDLGLKEDIFLTDSVTHVIRDGTEPASKARWTPREGTRTRADAMLQRVQTNNPSQLPVQHKYITLSVQKAVILLDKIYDTFFSAPPKANVRIFKKHFIKIEFLDKPWRPLFKEFDEWPGFSLEADPPKEKRREPTEINHNSNINNNNIGQKMTRKSRPRPKEKDEKDPKGGYCEMCNAEYADATLHRRSPNHVAFVRDHTNFLALDSLIASGADVATFLDKAKINGERRSPRQACNGMNGHVRPNTRQAEATKQYYKVVNTKLRSSGAFKPKEPPICNGAESLVVKFRKVRRSELSVLSDEAEQFMFPKRASSTSEDSSDEEPTPKSKSPPLALERRRLARPMAFKEDSSEEDFWPEEQKPRRRAPRGRGIKTNQVAEPEVAQVEPIVESVEKKEVSPLREDATEKCMKWEDGRLKYTPAVEQLEFAFESVPQSEPWYSTFKRQDEDKVVARNVSEYFSLYTKSPKLPYEIGQLPPLKPNCCHLSDLVKRDAEKAGPSRSYGTRGMKRAKMKKRTLAVIALESHPRKSPREHASTLAILGSGGILSRRKNDDSKSTASEDTLSEQSNSKPASDLIKLNSNTNTQETSERLQQFLSEVFEDASDYDISDEILQGEPVANAQAPDVVALVTDCDSCDIIREEMTQCAPAKRGKRTKHRNRTGWPKKRPPKSSSRTNSLEFAGSSASSMEREEALQSEVDIKSEDNSSCCEENGIEDEEEKEEKIKKKVLSSEWLQPVVRVARVDTSTARTLRSSGKQRPRRAR